MSEKRNLPKLRFPYFSGNWTTSWLSEIAEVKGGKRIPKGKALLEEPTPFPYITVSDMVNGSVSLEKIRFVPRDVAPQIKNYRIFRDEIFVSVAGTLGLVGIIPDSLDGANLTENANKLTNLRIHQKFLYHFLTSGRLTKLIDSVATLGAQPKLAIYALNKLEVTRPSLPEQQKIAEFLTTVDKRIELLQAKKEKLEAYKKGVMQQIFSQKLRFKADDGSDFPDWEEKKLGEISSNVGYGLNSSAIEFDGKHKYIRITDIDEETNKFVPSPLTSPDQIPNQSYQVSEGDILFARTGASVGKSYIYRKEDGELYFAGFLIRFSIRNENPYFVFLQTKRSEYRKWVKIMSMRSGQPGINAEEYKSFKFKVPSLPEQEKIASFLTGLDSSMETLEKQINQTQTWKKGLLQKMFV